MRAVNGRLPSGRQNAERMRAPRRFCPLPSATFARGGRARRPGVSRRVNTPRPSPPGRVACWCVAASCRRRSSRWGRAQGRLVKAAGAVRGARGAPGWTRCPQANCALPGWPPTAGPTARSPGSCTSPSKPSKGTSPAPTPSSGSRVATSCREPLAAEKIRVSLGHHSEALAIQLTQLCAVFAPRGGLIAAIDDAAQRCGRELCGPARVNMSGTREPGRSSDDDIPGCGHEPTCRRLRFG
jgi:hypothetical protein